MIKITKDNLKDAQDNNQRVVLGVMNDEIFILTMQKIKDRAYEPRWIFRSIDTPFGAGGYEFRVDCILAFLQAFADFGAEVLVFENMLEAARFIAGRRGAK